MLIWHFLALLFSMISALIAYLTAVYGA